MTITIPEFKVSKVYYGLAKMNVLIIVSLLAKK